MSSDNIAISIKDIRKCFYVYNNPHDRLKQFVLPKLKRLITSESENYYKEFWALNGISFDVMKGETVGLIGKNGSGKSTLLQVICGTLTATSGTVETTGRIAALLELGSGFNPEFTGRENIYLNAAILGLSKSEIDNKFDAIAAFADIGDFIEQPVKTYSSGMVVRLAFAVQAQVDPDILIVDEALAVGDAKFQAKCFDRLRQLKNNGTSILLVTHSGEQIVTHCDKAVLLSGGNKLYQGSPKVAVNKYMDILFGKTQSPAKDDVVTEASAQGNNTQNSASSVASGLSLDADCFNTKANYNKNEYRWGDRAASWLDYQLFADERLNPATVYADEKIKIRCSIYFEKNIHNPIIGFAVKTKEGVTVYNTNSHLLNEDTLQHGRENTHSIVEFEFDNKLGAGDYFISLGIASMKDNEVVPHDRRYDVIHFLVPTVESFSGMTNLELNLKINSSFGK
ncbi:ABC transporter ATP-binding protein [Serratia sp. JSRIV004]|uniref:ABC transporter ATP-binding protein n=1 Tax=Serratia sp. JSRIV004 TaxID=2831895 RepID=UPI001CC0C9B9|nr:ABC transporter ATP-binding protein [Serratia sp. JSRIV004]UAN59444.1 ABC transporter ATP-binding protein [Serratia sp. JSRIV004]